MQGLRGVAVLLVVLAHAGMPGLGGGYIGVDVFFVLSGYLISSLLLHEATSTGSVSLVAFYARRARRILPAATLTLVTTALLATLVLPYVRADQVVQDVLWATFFAANIHVASVGTDYFTAGQPPSPVQHFWSLAVEEQFYVVWPVALVLVLAVGLRTHRAGAAGARRRVPLLALLVALTCVLSYLWADAGVVSDPTGTYFSTIARMWELGAGALLAMFGTLPARLPFALRAILGWAGLAAIVFATVSFDETTAVPGSAALLPVLGTVALLAAGTAGAMAGAARLLSGRAIGWLGDVSYSFYLWHWPALVLPAAYLGHELSLLPGLGMLLIALALSALTSRLLERPVRRVNALARRPDLALSLWPLAVSAVLGTALWCGGQIAVASAAGTSIPTASSSAVLSPTAGMPTNSPPEGTPDAAVDEVVAAVDEAVLEGPVPALRQDLRTLAGDKWDHPSECVAMDEEPSTELCPVGDTAADRTIVLLGDSHAGMWLPAFDALGRDESWEVVPIVKYGCPAIDWPTWAANDRPATDCSEFHDWAVDQIADLEPELVVVASRALLELADETQSDMLPEREALDAWEAGMHSALKELSTSAERVQVVLGTPSTPQPPADCLSASGATLGDCTFQLPQVVSEVNARTSAAAVDAGAGVIDMTPLVCAAERCPMVVRTTAVYADDNHLSATYVDQIGVGLTEQLDLPDR